MKTLLTSKPVTGKSCIKFHTELGNCCSKYYFGGISITVGFFISTHGKLRLRQLAPYLSRGGGPLGGSPGGPLGGPLLGGGMGSLRGGGGPSRGL